MATPNLSSLTDSLLLIVDIQTRLTEAMPMKVLARLQRNTGLLLRSARTLEVPVYASERHPEEIGELEPEIVKLLPPASRRFRKTSFSMAGAPGFMDALAASGRRQIVLCGMEAHICVQQSAMDLVRAGYETFLVSDAVCSRQRESYEVALARMRDAGVIITDAEAVLYEWMGDSSHPQFKNLQPLVR